MQRYEKNPELQRLAGPGQWNDPDMVRESRVEKEDSILKLSIAASGQLLAELRGVSIAIGHLGHHGSSADNEQRSGNGATRDQGITAKSVSYRVGYTNSY